MEKYGQIKGAFERAAILMGSASKQYWGGFEYQVRERHKFDRADDADACAIVRIPVGARKIFGRKKIIAVATVRRSDGFLSGESIGSDFENLTLYTMLTDLDRAYALSRPEKMWHSGLQERYLDILAQAV